MNSRRKWNIVFALFAGLIVFGAIVIRGVPQTIVVDGANDFLVANLIDPDGGDTQYTEIDLDSMFVTNDANKIYFGIKYDKGTWSNNQIGVHISVNDATGGTTDSWGRAIAWTNAPHKPDFQAYCNLDNSWQELRHWSGSAWDVVYDGTNSLGWVNGTGFEEFALNLSDLGVSMGDTIYFEIVSTQDGSTKGPLDCLANDDDQLSTPISTVWDVDPATELDSMYCYVIQVTGDTDPPTVLKAGDDDVPGSVVEAGIDDFLLTYSEPVDQTTAENASNYTLTGTTASIDSVRRLVASPDRVRIYVDDTIMPSGNFVKIEVMNVEDLNSNVIVDNDTTNVGCFYRKGILFRGRMSQHLLSHSVPPDTFSVEGGLAPLTWGGCDNAIMGHVNGGVYEVLVGFSLAGTGCYNSPYAEKTLEWKFMHQCTEYEGAIGNRNHLLSSANSAYDTIDVWWDDLDPGNYTDHPIDVIFSVDVNSMSPGGGNVVSINGSELPLTFVVPSITDMADDGNPPDDTASDGIYAITVRFPESSFKDVKYKYLYDQVYECTTQGNREVYLNDGAYDTVGGANGPLEMPLQYYDRCNQIGRDVEVVFRVTILGDPLPTDTMSVNGAPNNQLPEVINWNVPSINPMDPDPSPPPSPMPAGFFTVSIIFPDSSDKHVDYKYLWNEVYECTTQGNRYFYIDDAYDAVGNPQILDLDYFNSCDATGVEDDIPIIPISLHQNYPNPFNPVTTIRFTMPADGRAVLRIYDVRGALVKTVLDDVVHAGNVEAIWDGMDSRGRQVASGVYFYELRTASARLTRKMVLLR